MKTSMKALLAACTVAVISVTAWWFVPHSDGSTVDNYAGQREVSLSERASAHEPSAEAEASARDKSKKVHAVAMKPVEDGADRESELLRLFNETGTAQDLLRKGFQDGGADSSAVQEFLYQASLICSPTQLIKLQAGPFANDAARHWAIEGLVSACADFDPKEFTVAGKTVKVDTTPADFLQKFGDKAAIDAAIEVVGENKDFLSLADAGRILALTEGFPPHVMQSIKPLGLDDRLNAWTNAANLYNCQLGGGCGANSLRTLSLCSNIGCRPSSDMRSALQQSVPPRQWAAILAYLQWIESMRRQRGTG